LHRISPLYTINRIHDWNLEGTSAWLNVLRKRVEAPILFVRHDEQKVKDIVSNDAS
jgi:hypothetical protein